MSQPPVPHVWNPGVTEHRYEPGDDGWCAQCGGRDLDPLHVTDDLPYGVV
jgi:hypothetical protein